MTLAASAARSWPSSARDRARSVERWLKPYAKLERRTFLQRGYSPSALTWLGVPVPDMRRVARDVARRLAGESPRQVIALAGALARSGSIEARQVGYEVLARRDDAMAALNRARIERLGRGNDNWAAVDGFASCVSGPAWVRGVLSDADVRRWARSRDRWWRRTALVSTVSLNVRSHGGTGDTRRTLMICEILAGDPDPMLVKAQSWALRVLASRSFDPIRLA